ncbi:hypothetical protein ER13_03205 [Brevundimonas sp. EAKA]|uniref:Uncharacterized protein n=1 Tax=Brevundimonas mediterranea TaxID=74329 RepID=A0A6G7EL22_9CAUL|nr:MULTISPECIES: hypothetical protein [Brevundimonas]MBU4196985.1 hypothetical protein [Alphaproteobacteria bacterium]OGN48415.1 MAG: hypothetical protein A3E24_07320 [Caulobacterales bacterium RIFCSPHIGHO2_12_FULL_68_13]OGN48551.1 MAG: hypothetical protein A3K57_04000 [Caulobacterales bacterium RIFOXYA1_FULL_67_7]OGN48830.1 MAG: hypothetical protein A2795_12465 [Caulobacterales bacterium RIFCSPHIGHO2_01_FULL_67_30]OYX80453.1 MAG: hypothetical protein B7Y85_05380 [Brevundimonas sp. 32-68-21]
MTEPTVNSQIKDAVQTSTNWALGFAPLEQGTPSTSTRVSAGGAIAYDKATQAAALSVQDAADYQRNMLSISTTVQGKAMAMMLASGGMNEPALVAYAMALVSSFAAPIAAGLAAESVTTAVKTFPRN